MPVSAREVRFKRFIINTAPERRLSQPSRMAAVLLFRTAALDLFLKKATRTSSRSVPCYLPSDL